MVTRNFDDENPDVPPLANAGGGAGAQGAGAKHRLLVPVIVEVLVMGAEDHLEAEVMSEEIVRAIRLKLECGSKVEFRGLIRVEPIQEGGVN